MGGFSGAALAQRTKRTKEGEKTRTKEQSGDEKNTDEKKRTFPQFYCSIKQMEVMNKQLVKRERERF